MRTTGAELRSEAAIYAEGTDYDTSYLANAYDQYANDCENGDEEPEGFQRWIKWAFPSCCK